MRNITLRALLLGTMITGLAYTPAKAMVIDFAGAPADRALRASPIVQLDPLSLALEKRIGTKAKRKAAFERKRDRAAIQQVYKASNFQPIWMENGSFNAKAKEVMAMMAQAEIEGLNPADYTLPTLDEAALETMTVFEQQAFQELALSAAVLKYTRHAASGRVRPRDISKNITIKRHLPDPLKVLNKFRTSQTPAADLAAYNPPHAGYKRLREHLATLRSLPDSEISVQIPKGRSLRLGMKGKRVALLRQRLNVVTEEGQAPRFDKDLQVALKAFQEENGLTADGVAGPMTLATLNRGTRNKINDVIANMERWRWLPRELGAFYIMANVPEYMVRVVNTGKTIHKTRIVVGKPRNQTPIFSDRMEHVVVNPYWNVPRSIATKEMLPQAQKDPTYFARRGYQVISTSGKPIDPGSVDWTKMSQKTLPFRFRQPPGARNALGNIKFLFPNRHAVYMHDTPSRSLFNRSYRAYSHGCVRIKNPFEFADAILTSQKNISGKTVRSLRGGKERWVNLKRKIPVYLVYFTASITDNGKLRIENDIYGHHARTKKALAL